MNKHLYYIHLNPVLFRFFMYICMLRPKFQKKTKMSRDFRQRAEYLLSFLIVEIIPNINKEYLKYTFVHTDIYITKYNKHLLLYSSKHGFSSSLLVCMLWPNFGKIRK